MAAIPDLVIKVDDSRVDALIAKLEEARALLLEIHALMGVPMPGEDADGANPPPSTEAPA